MGIFISQFKPTNTIRDFASNLRTGRTAHSKGRTQMVKYRLIRCNLEPTFYIQNQPVRYSDNASMVLNLVHFMHNDEAMCYCLLGSWISVYNPLNVTFILNHSF